MLFYCYLVPMKSVMLGLFVMSFGCVGLCQDYNTLLKEAQNWERQVDEVKALSSYKKLAATYPNDMTANVKSAQLLLAGGARIPDKKQRAASYALAKPYVEAGWLIDSNHAEVNYTMALYAGAMAEVETEKKKVAEWVRINYLYASRALAINTNHGKANYIMGKWHYQVSDMSWVAKSAMKAFMGGLPAASLDSAVYHMEKCKALEPYYAQNFYTLATLYKQNNRPAEALAVLNMLVKLPLRTADDARLKEEGKAMLQEMK